jgi:hypothetical protein
MLLSVVRKQFLEIKENTQKDNDGIFALRFLP